MSSQMLHFGAVATLLFCFGLTPGFAESPPEPQGSGEASAPSESERQLLEEAEGIAQKVADLRGLELKQEIPKGIKNRDQLREALLEKLSEEVTDAEIANEAKVFKRLGLMRPEVDYKQMMLDVLTEQIAGFYDQQAKELYIMEGIPLDLQRPAMAHEIFHAIQDQHFDIEGMLAPFSSQENGDFSVARMALIEGDATVVMIDFILHEMGLLPQRDVRSIVDIPQTRALLLMLNFDNLGALEQMLPGTEESNPFGGDLISDSALGQTPPFLQELLLFPYFGGLRFVILSRSGRSWSEFNRIYDRPPVSTEQILHPERYFADDQPIHVEFEAAPVLADYDKIYDTVLGELQLYLWLKNHLVHDQRTVEQSAPSNNGVPIEDPVASRLLTAAEGWGGDRLLAFEAPDGRVLVSHLSTWDTIADAREFYQAHLEVAEVRFPDATVAHNEGKYGQSACLQLKGPDGPERVYIERWADMVLYIEGTPSRPDAEGRETDHTTFRLRDHIWQTVGRSSFEQLLEARQANSEQ